MKKILLQENCMDNYPEASIFDAQKNQFDESEIKTIKLPALIVCAPKNVDPNMIEEFIPTSSSKMEYEITSPLDGGHPLRNLVFAKTKPMELKLIKPKYLSTITLNEFAENNSLLIKNEKLLIYKGDKSYVMSLSEAVKFYGTNKIFARLYTNAMHDVGQATTVIVLY